MGLRTRDKLRGMKSSLFSCILGPVRTGVDDRRYGVCVLQGHVGGKRVSCSFSSLTVGVDPSFCLLSMMAEDTFCMGRHISCYYPGYDHQDQFLV